MTECSMEQCGSHGCSMRQASTHAYVVAAFSRAVRSSMFTGMAIDSRTCKAPPWRAQASDAW